MQSSDEKQSTWFFKTTSDPNVKPKQHAIDNAKSLGHALIIDKQVPNNRWFGSYASVNEYIQAMGKENHHMYEVITQGRSKIYLDVEYTPDKGDATKVKEIINDLIQYINKDLQTICLDNHICLSQSTGIGERGDYKDTTKYSFHIVVNNGYYVEDNRKIKTMLAPFLNKWKGLVDHQVYGMNQSFKLPYQSKLDSKRVQRIVQGDFKDHFVTYVCDDPRMYDMKVIDNIPIEQREIVITPRENVFIDTYVNLNDVVNILNILPNDGADCDYDYYLKVMMVCKNEGVPYDTFEEWAKKYPRCNLSDTRAQWDRLQNRGGKGLGIGTLRWLLKRFYPNLDKDIKQKFIAQCTQPTVDFEKQSIKHIVYNERYLLPFDYAFIRGFIHLIIKSHLGTGKTTQIRKAITVLEPKSILVITPRVMFARSMYGAIKEIVPELKMYQEIVAGRNNPNARHEHPYIVCQLESLHTLRDSYDFVIVDESESILSQFSSTTMRSQFVDVYKKFESIISNAKWCVWSDAFVTDRTIMTCKRLSMMREGAKQHTMDLYEDGTVELSKSILYIENTYQPYNRKAVCVGENNAAFLQFLERYTKANPNKRLVIVCSSKQASNSLKDILPNVLVINSDTDDAIKKQMEDVNTLWCDKQYVAYTSSITVGVNYDHENHFDDLVMSFSACSASPRDTMQSSLRARSIKSNTLYYTRFSRYCVRNKVHFEVYDRKELFELLEQREHWALNNSEFQKHNLPKWVKYLWVYNTQENNVSAFMHKEMVDQYLNICGYQHDDFAAIMNVDALTCETTPNASYDEIDDVDYFGFRQVMDRFVKGDASAAEKLIIKKYYFKNYVIRTEGVSNATLMIMFDCWHKNTQDIEDRMRHTRIEMNGLTKSDEVCVFVENIEQKLDVIKQIHDILGIKGTYEIGKEIERQVLEATADRVIGMKEDITKVFNLRDQGKKDTTSGLRKSVTLINKVLNTWGFTEIVKKEERKTKRVDGKKVDVTNYEILPIVPKKDGKRLETGNDGFEDFLKHGRFEKPLDQKDLFLRRMREEDIIIDDADVEECDVSSASDIDC
jgi:hypothetical protein